MVNHMKEVAKMLGVDLNEEFHIKNAIDGERYKFRITQYGLEVSYPMSWGIRDWNRDYAECDLNSILVGLLFGEFAIVKL